MVFKTGVSEARGLKGHELWVDFPTSQAQFFFTAQSARWNFFVFSVALSEPTTGTGKREAKDFEL